MIRSKIDPSKVKEMAWKDYAKLFDKDVKQAAAKGVDKVPLVMISDFEFACGEIHALMLLGKQSELTKFYKSLKMDPTRKQLKDFSIGFCHFDQEEEGGFSMRISIEGFGKPTKMKKNSRKLIKKLGVNLKDIIKGVYTDEVVDGIEQEPVDEESQVELDTLQERADTSKATTNAENDLKSIRKVAREFVEANKDMATEVISLLKLSKTEAVVYTQHHVHVAEEAFEAAASLLDKYEELEEAGQDISKAKKIVGLKDQIVQNDLVRKYETIWKKVTQEYTKMVAELSTPFQEKLAEYHRLLEEIGEEEETTAPQEEKQETTLENSVD